MNCAAACVFFSRLTGRWLLYALAAAALWSGLNIPGYAAEPVKVAILAFRPADVAQARWQPLADYLNKTIAGHRFELKVVGYPELETVIAARQVDFVLTQPLHYVTMTYRNGLSSPLATLVENVGGSALSLFGGVIVAQAGRNDIATLSDIKGKTVATSSTGSLSSYQMQTRALIEAGIKLPQDATILETGQPQDRAIESVLAGKADIGFVRTGVIEAMAKEGKLDIAALKILNQQTTADFPQQLSTRLYPEWAFAAMPEIDGVLARQVAAALLLLPHGGELTKALGIHGFAIPADYHPVDDLMRELRLPPFDATPDFSAGDVWTRYRFWLVIGVAAWSLILLGIAIRLLIYNHRLRAKRAELRQSMARLSESETRQKTILHALGEGVCGADGGGRCTFINATALSMLQISERDALGRDLHGLLHRLRGDAKPYPRSDCPSCLTLQDGISRSQEDWLIRKDGSGFPVWLTATPLNSEKSTAGVIVAFRDIGQDKAVENELRKLSQAVEQSPVSIVITDLEGRIEYVNEYFVGNTGYSREELIGQNPRMLASGETPPATYMSMWETIQSGATWQGEFINKRKDHSEFTEYAIVAPIRYANGRIGHYLAVKQDVTRRKADEEKIKYLAFYDSLTHLPNRRLLIDRLRLALHATALNKQHGALLLIDLDNFKTLNDTHGHAIGDILLQQIAPWIACCLRPGDTVARLGGDEFIVMLQTATEDRPAAEAEVRAIAQKIVIALNQTFRFDENEHHSSASIGITLFSGFGEVSHEDNDETVDALLRQTDLAMYEAKAAGRNTLRFFDHSMQAEVTQRAALETDLRQGVREGQFVLHYQAQVDAIGRLTGAEALVRWLHPKRGLVAPADFIPLAEDTGLILPLGHWVLETACHQLAVWAKREPTAHLTIAVNISARQLRHVDFVAQVLSILEETGANPARLKLELTESLLLHNIEETIRKMLALKARGIGFSLDDFGTGYSSLSYLKRLPLDQLKIDQSFVRDLLLDPNDAAIARTIVALAESMGLAVIAEGVETVPQRDLLAGIGCHAYQGYLYGRPGTAVALHDPIATQGN